MHAGVSHLFMFLNHVLLYILCYVYHYVCMSPLPKQWFAECSLWINIFSYLQFPIIVKLGIKSLVYTPGEALVLFTGGGVPWWCKNSRSFEFHFDVIFILVYLLCSGFSFKPTFITTNHHPRPRLPVTYRQVVEKHSSPPIIILDTD